MFTRKKKCKVCGYRVTPTKEAIYTAEAPRSFTEVFSKPPTCFDVTDCPRCGCQIALSVRVPAVPERDESAAEEEAKICAGGCIRNYAEPLEHCDECSFGKGAGGNG